MKMSKKKIFLILISFLIVSFLIYNVVSKADTDSDKIAIKNIKMTGISTGKSNFTSDGLNYGDESSYQKVTGYNAGYDANEKNRIVRSFDELIYTFDFSITGKNDDNSYEERKVDITVVLPDEVAKYVAFDKIAEAGETTHTYTFEGIDTYGNFERNISLYVLGAPNGTQINPKFEIKESTNTDSNYVVTLGNASDNTYNYEYNKETNNYSTTPTVLGFTNYMPTIVSSRTANLRFKLLSQSEEGQKATYNNKVGRYLTYVLGMELVGDDTNGIKGYTMPNGNDITFNLNISQNGSVTSLTTSDDWVRLYGQNTINSIEPVKVALPYSSDEVESSKKAKYPGNISLSNNSATISDYKTTYSTVVMNADGSNLPKSEHIIGTYALTVFSERSVADGINDINVNMSIDNINAHDTSNSALTVPAVNATKVNKYYENSDYSLVGSFYDESGTKLSTGDMANGKGATSKGTSLTYKTTFKYKKTLSSQGLKEVIKIDPNAYRVMKIGNEDIKIDVTSTTDTKLTKDDFEVQFISGDYKNANYQSNSNFERITSEELSTVQSTCSTVTSNLSSYSQDQIMNLYGGPCIKAKDNTELVFDSLSDAKTDDNKEVPISKIIVQTKDGISLPDDAIVNIEVGVRVRNVSDLTQTYQATVVASSSDYDSKINYYSPRVTTDENSITSPNNYRKTTYAGTNIASIDSNPWGDSLKIVNFTSRQTITVTNKNKDGSIKTNYNVNKGETLNYNIKTTISDENEKVGADDVWYINSLKVVVTIPAELTYIPDSDLGTPEVSESAGVTTLVYTLPYTKPNMTIPDINFKATIKPTIKGTAVPITVTSKTVAININGETDTSYFGNLVGSFKIYATGIENVIVSQKVGDQGSVVEKNSEFSYLLGAYNNTNSNISDYSIVDILPNNNDNNGSKFTGSYKVKVTLPDTLSSAKVYCSTQEYSKLANEVFNENNQFEECNITDEFVEATAIKITDISINKNSYMNDIKVTLKAEGNEFEDKYINSFVGASRTYSQNESNEIKVRIISRNISGRVFIDNNENGVEDKGDTYLENIPLTLYKLDSENNLTEIEDTVSNKNGYYEFKNLNSGRYKVRASYNVEKYDLALRYATEDVSKDSDAYKLEDGLAEISNKKTPNESDGIMVNREIESVKDMNIGLISRRTFGFDIDKYITKVDLTYNNNTVSTEYANQKIVKSDVKNSWKATAKVYYGIKVTNNSSTSGYVKLINESIPAGATFDLNDPINEGWFYTNGELQNISLADELIEPGESRYLKIALNIPPQQEARNYVNTVTLLDVEQYEPETLAEDTNADSNLYNLGESITYAGVDWHVINVENQGNGEQMLTLLADSSSSNVKMGHTSSKTATYKWSESLINKYINSDYPNTNSLNVPILVDTGICDDASGLPAASYGGTLRSEGTCQSNVYNNYKIRLLSEYEYNKLKASNLEDLSWLYGNYDFWLMNSVYVEQNHNSYGQITDITNVKNLAKYSSKTNAAIQTGYSTNINNWVRSNTLKEVRPVITISNKNIIPE